MIRRLLFRLFGWPGGAHPAAIEAASWWVEEIPHWLNIERKEAFYRALVDLVSDRVRAHGHAVLNVTYVPQGLLADALTSAGIEHGWGGSSAMPVWAYMIVYPEKLVMRSRKGGPTFTLKVRKAPPESQQYPWDRETLADAS